jgi:hemerythrin HHE cation binding domain-containing protein
MSLIDKVIGAVTPPESDEARHEARARARAAATDGSWLSALLDHHLQIEGAFDAVREATDADARLAAQKELALILSSHSSAEEAVVYPAIAQAGEKAHAVKAYTEQSAAKLQLGLLEYLAPMSQDYLDKLEHIRGAVLHHIYEEESTWFLQLNDKLGAGENARLKLRYLEEFERSYNSPDVPLGVLAANSRSSGAPPRL